MSFKKTAEQLIVSQLIWTLWAAGIFLIIQVIQIIIAIFFGGNEVDYFYNASFIAGNIYMFIIGIIVIYSLPYFVENGVTRKEYFKGNVVAAVVVSIVIPIVAYILSVIIRWILTVSSNTLFSEPDFSTLPETDTNIIGDIIQSFILAPFVDTENNLILSLGLFSLNLFIFYLIGWLIGSAFYRLDVVGGILFVIIGIALNAVKDSMLRVLLDQPLFENFSFMGNASYPVAIIALILIIVISITLIRLLTKHATIKI